MRTYSYNWGKLLLVRFLLVGWTFQGIHTLDWTERTLRVALEVLISLLAMLLLFTAIDPVPVPLTAAALVIIHTAFWICDSSWLTGMRECLGFINNRGLHRTVDYLDFARSLVEKSAKANAILVYGSLCRRAFHKRSDLDLRIVRKTGVGAALTLFFLCIFLRLYGMYRFGVLLDLRMVDTMDFLRREMRSDEQPIVVLCAPGFCVPNPGEAYTTLRHNPQFFLRK